MASEISLADSYWQTLTGIAEETPKAALGFVICVLLYFTVVLARERRLSLGAVLRNAFPKQMYSGDRFRVDVWNWVLHKALFDPLRQLLILVVAVGIGVGLADLLASWFGPRPPLIENQWAIGAAQFWGGFLGASFFDYWIHRAAHRVPWLWSLHRAHHSTEALTFFAAARSHPLDGLLIFGIGSLGGAIGSGIALFSIGAQEPTETSLMAAVLLYLFTLSFQVLGHSHIPVSFGWFNLVVPGPVMHQIHHSAELRHRDKNFSAGFLLWDLIFGTLYLPETRESFRIGLNEEERGERNPHRTVRDLYIEPLVHMTREVRKAL